MKKTIAALILSFVALSFSVQANACTAEKKENGSVILKGCTAKERADFIAKMEPVVIKSQVKPQMKPQIKKTSNTANTQFADYKKDALDAFREKVKAEKSAFAKEIESDLASVGIRSTPTSAFAELESF